MNRITIVPLGPGPREYLTYGAVAELRKARKCFLRTARCDAADFLVESGIPFRSFDDLYETAEDFDDLNRSICAFLLREVEAGDICYAVFDPVRDAPARQLLSAYSGCTVLPGVSLSAPFFALVPCDHAVVQTATDLCVTDSQHDLLIVELENKFLASDCVLRLEEWYDPEDEVIFFPPSGTAQRKAVHIPLRELVRQKKFDHTAAVLLPAHPLMQKKRYDTADLIRIMSILRGDSGCEWDKAQTHESLQPYLIEEAYETAAAIQEGDYVHMAEELGDVLLQVVFQADIGTRSGTITLGDITTSICKKMIERHPHIFAGDRNAPSWEEIKKQSRGFRTQSELMADLPVSLPPLMRAEKVQSRAAQVGFDWTDPLDALAKVEEEAEEVRQAARGKDRAHLTEELGDLFFACVNTARLFGEECEVCVQRATDKFVRRFSAMEKAILEDGKRLSDMSLEQMDAYWEKMKQTKKEG